MSINDEFIKLSDELMTLNRQNPMHRGRIKQIDDRLDVIVSVLQDYTPISALWPPVAA
jgi:hypothetical protein